MLIVLALLLVVGNGFFVAAEFAVLTARRARLEASATAPRATRAALEALGSLPLMIASCQFGITLCSLGLGALGEPAVAHLLAGPAAELRVPDAAVHTVAFAVALVVVSGVHMVLGEMVPKNVALAGPEATARALAPLLLLFTRLFRPVIVALTGCASAVLRLLRIPVVHEVGDTHDRDAVAALVHESGQEGLLEDHRHARLAGALTFDESVVGAVMLPLDQLRCVPADVTPARVEKLVADTGFTRFPVCADAGAGGVAGRPLVGYVHLADILEVDAEDWTAPLRADLIRPLATVPVSAPLHLALAEMRRRRAHMLAVTGDRTGAEPADGPTHPGPVSGPVVGVVVLEDVLEELVGEVRDATRRQPRRPAAARL